MASEASIILVFKSKNIRDVVHVYVHVKVEEESEFSVENGS